MKRVLHVLFNADLSGGQILAQRLGVALRERGWDSQYLLPRLGPLTELLDAASLQWTVVRMDGGPLRVAWRLRDAFLQSQPTLVHTHLVLPTQLAARLATASLKMPAVVHYHVPPTFPPNRTRRSLYSIVDRVGANRLTACNIAVSREIA